MDISDVRDELIEIYGVTDVLRVNIATTDSTPKQVSSGSEVIQSLVTQSQSSQLNKSKVKPALSTSSSVSASSSSIDTGDLSWDSFNRQLLDCKRCKLHEFRKNIVFGEGDQSSELMFLGEGPGASEDEQGRPFVGRSGKLLTDMIKAMGYDRSEVYIANIVKCRPPGNREPFKDEVSACIPFLHMQIELIKPKVIVCLGSTATSHILDLGQKISHLRGKFQEYRGIKVMPTYHPAYLLRNGTKKRDVWNDLQEVMKVLGKKA